MATEAAGRPQVTDSGAPLRPRTIVALWRDVTAAGRTNPAYLVEGAGGWQPVGWEEAARRVDDLAHGLLALGVGKGEVVAIVARTRLEWVLLDYAIALVGAVSVPVYPNSSAAETAYIVAHSEAVLAFAEDGVQRDKVESARGEGAPLRDVIVFDELDALAERGRTHREREPGALDVLAAAVMPEDLFTIIYTSGTTGPPKGCMILHRNYHAMTSCLDRLEDFVGPTDTMLLYLPLAHNFGRLMHLMGAYAGFTTALLDDPYRAGDVMPRVRPTVVPSVPRVYEKIQAAVQSQFDAATGVRRRLIDWALAVGRRVSLHAQRGEPLPRGLALQHRLADRLVYAKVKARLGGRLRFGISGGAPLAPEIAAFLHTLDVLVLEGYGLTECTTACSVNRPSRFRFGTVGPALPGSEIRVADDGEVLIRSDTVFAGYLKDDAATVEVLDADGWLRSGDLGELDADGFLRITGRKKDILVTAGGKNVAPQNVESALKAAALVSQVVVVGDRRPYLVALVTLEPEALEAWARDRGLPGTPEELTRLPETRAAVQAAVDDANRGLSRHEQIRRFAVLPRDLTIEDGELTATLKVRRSECERRYADVIDALYAQPAPASG
jgi:long-chain acyl-CoA synthetase